MSKRPKVPREVLLKDYNYDLSLKENLKRLKEKEGLETSYIAAFLLIKDKLKSYREQKNKKAEELYLKYKEEDPDLSLIKLQKILIIKEGKNFKMGLLKKINNKYKN